MELEKFTESVKADGEVSHQHRTNIINEAIMVETLNLIRKGSPAEQIKQLMDLLDKNSSRGAVRPFEDLTNKLRRS